MSQPQLMHWEPYSARVGDRPHSVVGDVRVMANVYSPQLDNAREVKVYLPPSYDATDRRYPVVYMQDGQNLFDRITSFSGDEWRVDETMERLSEEGVEAIIVGIDHAGRERITEYNPFPTFWRGRGEDYLRFVVNTVKPLIDRDFRTLPDRAHTGIAGSSMGGLISLYGYFAHRDVFGFAGVFSPSLWVGAGSIYAYVQQVDYVPGRIYLDNGSREGSARRMNMLLTKKGYAPNVDLLYVVEEDGEHTESAWARRLPEAMRFLLKDAI